MDPQSARPAQLEALREALGSGAVRQVGRLVKSLHPGEIADLIEALPPTQRELIWKLVNPQDEGEILVELNEAVRATLIQEMDTEQLVAAAARLNLDDLADLFADLPEAVTQKVLTSLDQSDRLRLEAVLQFDEDSAGGLMDPDTLTVRGDVSIKVVLRYLRLRSSIPDGTDAIFVVNRQTQYQGCLFVTTILTADPNAKVSHLMNAQIRAISANTPAADVALMFETNDLVSAAVVDDSGTLLGRITIDDVVDVIRHQADHSLLSMAGLDEDDDMFAPVGVSTKRRSIWLGVNLATAFIAAGIAGLFEATLERVVMLAILMPVGPSMGGIAGSQTLIIVT